MEERLFTKLEFNKIRAMLAALAYSPGGKELAGRLVPHKSRGEVEKAFDQLEEAMELLRFKEPSFLHGIRDVSGAVNKADKGGMLHPTELLEVASLLKASRLGNSYLDTNKCQVLRPYLDALLPQPVLEKDIEKAIDDDGQVRDDASDQLRKVRRDIENLRSRIKSYMQEFIRSASGQVYLQESLVTERAGRYVVPVKIEYRSMVKGIVHDESASGATVFIEPMAAVEMNNKIRSLEVEEKREVERILRRLSSMTAVFSQELLANYDILVQLDLLFARGNLAYNMHAYRPVMRDDGQIDLQKARHPLLGATAVPIDVELGRHYDILVITGPNTGGKTVVLKTIGLFSLMAMSGLYVPARENSVISMFTNIFVDIGDEQSLEQSLSTFSSHISNIISILSQTDGHSLVLLDELGAGTDPVEGAALARAIMVRLKELGARAVVTTHQSDLKNFAYQSERVENACVEFDPFTFQPTYQLTIGTPGQSNAFEIALRLGLNRVIVDNARSFVPDREKETANMIRRLKENQHAYDELHRILDLEMHEFQKEKDVFTNEKERFNEEHRKIIGRSRREADDYLRLIKKQADEALEEFKKNLKADDNIIKWHEIEKGRNNLKSLGVRPDTKGAVEAASELQIGDCVQISDIKQKGSVIAFPAPAEVEVQVGGMKLRVKRESVQAVERDKSASVRQYNRLVSDRMKDMSVEIDLRGKTVEESLYELDIYLDNAALCSLKSVRIIHGKGTGALRKAVREFLNGHRLVSSYRDAAYNEGGFGVTVVEMK